MTAAGRFVGGSRGPSARPSECTNAVDWLWFGWQAASVGEEGHKWFLWEDDDCLKFLRRPVVVTFRWWWCDQAAAVRQQGLGGWWWYAGV